MANKNLNSAKTAKNDEFFTQLTDIEKELQHYKEHFKDKIVYCNCDDHKWSNFFQYFSLNFEFLGLKKLVTTHYNSEGVAYKFEISKDSKIETPLKENGDFRSDECVEILKSCDIVVSNPPFSLFREYIELMVKYDKKYLIIGNKNAITYKETFKLIKESKLWLGVTSPNSFTQPENSVPKNMVGLTKWFTNLLHNKRNEKLFLYKEYNKIDYPKFDNYDAINVDKTVDIPKNYFGAIAVPISFLDKYNPCQFEIISANDFRINENVPYKEHGLIKDKDGVINGKPTYVRILIKLIQNNEN